MRSALLDVRPLRQSPGFARFWAGTTASAVGGQLTSFALALYVWDRTGDPAVLGLIGLAGAAPVLAFALVGGGFADRADRRLVALLTTSGQAVVTAVMAAVATSDGVLVWPMLLLAAASSALGAVGLPARRALVPQVLGPRLLPAGLALVGLSFQLAMLLGPVAAGLVTARFGLAWCFALDALTFAGALVGIAGLPGGRPADPPDRGGVAAVLDGLGFVARTPTVRGAFLTDLAATMLAMPMALFPVLNEQRFGGSPTTLGLMTTAVAVGGVTGSTLSGLVTCRRHLGRVLLGCAAVWGAALAAAGLAGSLPAVLALLALAGGADTWSVVARGSIVQGTTPDRYRGRVSSSEAVVGVAGPQLGGLRAGLLATRTSGADALLLGGLTCLAGVAAVALTHPGLRAATAPGEPAARPAGQPA